MPASAAQTLLGLQALIGSESRIPLDPGWIAKQLFDGMPLSWATDRIERDVLVLEDAGHVVTWAQDGREWLALPRSGPAAARHAPSPRGASCEPPSTRPIFIGLGEREREKERESARERALARVQAENRESSDRWALGAAERRPRKPPKRPRILDAPPRGCADHPNGTVDEECGPCGTAADIRKTWLANEKYLDELVLFEESQATQWEDLGRDTF
ncbi:hypothetical protein WDU99_01770 [Microbacterium sp. Mu-80]|uniref:Uncharacterized protein n=1 Tax=Microbacterium bandirmense TaxID=3122050 RepID=A0ABU8L7Q5_9MICO